MHRLLQQKFRSQTARLGNSATHSRTTEDGSSPERAGGCSSLQGSALLNVLGLIENEAAHVREAPQHLASFRRDWPSDFVDNNALRAIPARRSVSGALCAPGGLVGLSK